MPKFVEDQIVIASQNIDRSLLDDKPATTIIPKGTQLRIVTAVNGLWHIEVVSNPMVSLVVSEDEITA